MPARAESGAVSGSLPECSSLPSAWRATRGSRLSLLWEVQPWAWAPLQCPARLVIRGQGRVEVPSGRMWVRTAWGSYLCVWGLSSTHKVVWALFF